MNDTSEILKQLQSLKEQMGATVDSQTDEFNKQLKGLEIKAEPQQWKVRHQDRGVLGTIENSQSRERPFSALPYYYSLNESGLIHCNTFREASLALLWYSYCKCEFKLLWGWTYLKECTCGAREKAGV